MNNQTATRIQAERRQSKTRLLIWSLFALALLILPLVSSEFGLTVLTQICIAALFALSYNLLLGQTGILSFGHAVYFGMGGYFTIHLMNLISEGWAIPVILTPLFGGVFGLLIGALIGSFSTSRAGTVFAMISVGVAELIGALTLILISVFGGEEGVSADRTLGPALGGFDLIHQIEIYTLSAIWFFLATMAVFYFNRSPLGRMAYALRDNPQRVEFLGYSQRHVRFIAFTASGFFAGMAGALFAIQYEIVTDTAMNMAASGAVLMQTYIGGIGYFAGPIVGAALMTVLSSVVSGYTDLWLLYTGILFMATVLLAPSGLTGLVMKHQPIWVMKRMKLLIKPYLAGASALMVALIGAIGLMEMISHSHKAGKNENILQLFHLQLDITSVPPWISFALLLCLGIAGLFWTVPKIKRAWEEAILPGMKTPSQQEESPENPDHSKQQARKEAAE